MPRGRHRQSPPLHQLFVPAAVAGGALLCAAGVWLVGDPGFGDPATVALRGITAVTAAAAITGAVVLRVWDSAAGKRVQELRARQTSAEWRAEERQAELEESLDEAREERDKIRNRVLDQQATLARLRNEHASLLRRYAHAESERARVLESRRKLEIEAGEPAKALTAGVTDHRQASGAPTPLTYLQANQALIHLVRNHAAQKERREEQRRQREEQERKEEQRLAEERGRERARAAAAARQGPSKPASPPGLAPGGFDFFGTGPGSRKRHARTQRQELPDEVGARQERQERPASKEQPASQERPVRRERPVPQGESERSEPRHASRPDSGDDSRAGSGHEAQELPEEQGAPGTPEARTSREAEPAPETSPGEEPAPETEPADEAEPAAGAEQEQEREYGQEAGPEHEAEPEHALSPEHEEQEPRADSGPGTSRLRNAS